MNTLVPLSLVLKPLSFSNFLGSSFFRIIVSPLTLIHSLLFSMLVLPLACLMACAFLAAAAQATLIAVIDVKPAGRFRYWAMTTDIQLHNAPPRLKILKLNPAKRKKELEILHSREALGTSGAKDNS